MYHVWKRTDGYISVGNSRRPWKDPEGFSLLLATEDWPEARDAVLAARERDAATFLPLIASWKESP